RPEIQLFAAGTPDALSRSVDVAALSSWLAVRAIDNETRRLDAIERGEPPPPAPAPISIPPADAAEAGPASEPVAAVPLPPGRGPRRAPPKPRVSAPRPPAVNAPAPIPRQQAAPLPPAIDVRPPPGAVKPRPKPPLALTPQVANPPPFQN